MNEELVYRGKSKDVFKSKQFPGKYRFVFTDRACGFIKNGKPVFDPGYDNVVGEITGKGVIACDFATHFFKLLQEKNIPTHFIKRIGPNEMIVEPAILLGMPLKNPEFEGAASLINLEWTWRNNAMGSAWRRYPFITPCKNLFKVVEVWTKGKNDILITFQMLEAAGVLIKKEIETAEMLVQKIASIVTDEFARKGFHVIDGKFELGRLENGGEIVLIDEISMDVLRVCKGYDPDQSGNCKSFKQCIKTGNENGKLTIKAKNQVSAARLENLFSK